jgi:hypothetical protein
MKPFVCSWLLLAIVNLCVAQTTLPEFGDITGSDKKLTECPFDKEADAVVIFDEASADHNDRYNLITTRRIRLKILRQKGIRHGDIEIRYYSKDDAEYISDIEAYTCNYNNGVADMKKVASSSIYRQKINERWSQVKIAMPDVKVGSIIEYKYTTTSKNYGYLNDWYFQGEMPVMHSHFSLVVLPNYEFAYRVYKSDHLPIVVKQEKGSGRIYFQMDSIAGLRDEPFMDAEKDYLQHVEFQLSGYQSNFGGTNKYMTTWDELTRELMINPSFGTQLNKNLSGSDGLLNTVKLMASPFEKMSAIYNYVYKNIEWNGMGGKFVVDGVKEAWEKKKGNSGEINLIMINLMKEAGLEVYPLLVSERGHGKVNADYPFLDQFNKVMAYVLIDNRKYILDAAGSYTPAFMTPFSVINTKAFVVNRKKGGIIDLTETEKTDKNLVIINAKVNESGAMSGQAAIQSSEYARLTRLRAWERDKEHFSETYYTKYQTGMHIDSLNMLNINNDSMPLEQQFNFNIPPTVSGDYKLINLNLFSGIAKNPFISDIRFTNIDYGCLQTQTIIEDIELAPSLTVESLPKNVRMIMPDTSITLSRMMEFKNHTLYVRFTITTNRSVFTADEYPYIKDFYKKMADYMNEQVVLKKSE